MTERAAKILSGKRERALKALEDKNRFQENGVLLLRSDEAKTLLNWLKELLDERKGGRHGQD